MEEEIYFHYTKVDYFSTEKETYYFSTQRKNSIAIWDKTHYFSIEKIYYSEKLMFPNS